MAEGEGDVVQNLYSIYGFGKIFHHQDFISNLAVRAKINVWIFTAGGTHVIQLNFFKGTFTGSCLFGFGGIGTESGDELLQFLDFFFLFLVRFLHLFDEKLTGFKPEIVVSGIKLNFAIVNISRMSADLIQEITVMGYNNNGIIKVNQEFFQPFNRRKIQVVGRLIQKKDVRISKQCLCKKYFHLLAAGKICHL